MDRKFTYHDLNGPHTHAHSSIVRFEASGWCTILYPEKGKPETIGKHLGKIIEAFEAPPPTVLSWCAGTIL